MAHTVVEAWQVPKLIEEMGRLETQEGVAAGVQRQSSGEFLLAQERSPFCSTQDFI